MTARLLRGIFFVAVLAATGLSPAVRAQGLEVAGTEGDARLRDQPVAAGTVIREGAELRTGPEGYVGLRLPDGMILSILPASEVRLAQLRPETLVLVLQRGRVEAVPGKPPAGAGTAAALPIEVQTPLGTAVSRGGEFRVSLGNTGSGTLEAVGGALEFRPATGPALRLPSGTGIVLQASKPAASPRPLLPAPRLWGGLRLVPQTPFDLDFSPTSGARGYRVALHSLAERRGLVLEEFVEGAVSRLAGVANGDYAVRVRAVDPDGLHGLESVALLRLSVRGGPPRLSSPLDGARVYGDRATFFWRPKEDAEGYILEIARDPAFRALVTRTPQLPDPRHAAEGLAPGEYHWRVAARMPDGQLGLFSEGRSFSVRTGAPALAAPRIEAEGLRFSWPANPGQRFELQVAADREFRLVVAERVVDRTPVVLPRPAPGTYFARLRALEADGPGPYAAPVSFVVGAPPPKPACLVEGPKGVCAVFAPAEAAR